MLLSDETFYNILYFPFNIHLSPFENGDTEIPFAVKQAACSHLLLNSTQFSLFFTFVVVEMLVIY